MSDALLRSRLIRLASDTPEFRKELLPILAGGSEEPDEPEESEEEEDDDDDDSEDDSDKSASLRLARNLRLLSPEDRHLASGLLRLAQKMPSQRSKLLGLVTASLKSAKWDPKQIGEEKPGPLKKQPDESYLDGEFTQQEFLELREKQQGGNLASPDKFASEAELRRNLIRLAHANPKLRSKLLPLIAGCEKLPNEKMQQLCEEKKKEVDKDEKKS